MTTQLLDAVLWYIVQVAAWHSHWARSGDDNSAADAVALRQDEEERYTHLSSKYCLHRARTCTPSISPAIGLPCRKPLRLVVREVADRGRRPSPQETYHKTFLPPPPECLARRAHMARLGCSTARHDAGQNFDASILLPSLGCPFHPPPVPLPMNQNGQTLQWFAESMMRDQTPEVPLETRFRVRSRLSHSQALSVSAHARWHQEISGKFLKG